MKGAEVGSGSVVGAGSIVTKKFPNNVMLVGTPAFVKKRGVEWTRDWTLYNDYMEIKKCE